MHTKPVLFAVAAMALAVLSCNLPSGQEIESALLTLTAMVTGTPPGTAVPATLPPSATSAPGATPLAATACSPIVTANVNANVRKGPTTDYDAVGALLMSQSAPIAGRNAEGSWWYINFAAGPGGHGWIANSTVTASCLPASVAVIAPPPPPSGTCKDGYVWREAFSGDTVCVPPATRSQAAADNAAAASRWVSGAYGAHTCIEGFVWREATGSPSDDVCVTPDIRTQAAADNAAAASRLCTATYGPDTCAQGYVWREAFGNDHVCVSPEVRTQTANDNADAANHTWP